MADLEELKRKRDQLTARIQQAEARQKASIKKTEDRIKILVGAAVLNQCAQNPARRNELLAMMHAFLSRSGERAAVLGDDGNGSESFKRLTGDDQPPSDTTGVN